MLTFADLVDRNEHEEAWVKRMEVAKLFLRSRNQEAIVESVYRRIEAEFEDSGTLPDAAEIQEACRTQLGNTENRGVPGVNLDNVCDLVQTESLARFLLGAEPSLERLSAAAKIDRDPDISAIAAIVASSGAGPAWLTLLQGLRIDVSSLNDDEYLASDEATSWANKRKQPIPSWREGEHLSRGLEVGALASEMLRILDVPKWLEFLDRLPLPVLIDSFLWNTRAERTPEKFLDWIRQAPDAFDEDGQRTESVVVFAVERRLLALLEQAFARKARWGRATEAAENSTGLEATAFIRSDVAQAILSRKDGKLLLTELGAHYLDRAQAGTVDSNWTRLRHELYCAVGTSFAEAIGGAPAVLEAAMERARKMGDRSLWGLWLLSPARCYSQSAPVEEDVALETMRGNWSWLKQLLVDRDAGLAERYAPFAQWTEAFAAKALIASEDPQKELYDTWLSLTGQRLQRQESRYAKDSWKPSRFLIRVGFYAAHMANVDGQGWSVSLWQTAHRMAITAWFSCSTSEPFEEVSCGLAHLAKGNIDVKDEPSNTFSYLVGETDDVVDAVLAMLANGMDPGRLITEAKKGGVDPIVYLALARDGQKKDLIEKAREQLTSVAKSVEEA